MAGTSPHPNRTFKSPEELLACFEAYKDSLKAEATKWTVKRFVGKDGREVDDVPKLPLVLEGFYTWARLNGFGYIHQYLENKEGRYAEFVGIVNAIKQEIRADQITGGLIKQYDTSLTARLNNLAEKQDLDVNTKVTVSFKRKER